MRLTKLLTAFVLIILLTPSIYAQEATPEITPDQPGQTPEITEVPQHEAQGYVRFGHFAPDGPAVDVRLNEEQVAQGLQFTEFSDWRNVPTGSYTLNIAAGDNATENTLQSTLEIAQDTWVTVGIVPPTGDADGGLGIAVVPQVMYTELPSTAQVTFVNAMTADETIDFQRDDVIFMANVPRTTAESHIQNTLPVDARVFNYNVLREGEPILEATEVDTNDTSSYLLVAVGSPDDPQLLVDETPNWEIRLLDGTLAAPGTLLEVMQTEPLAAPFLAALEQADLTDVLTEPGPITLFVPADFVMDDVDLSTEELAGALRNHMVEGDYRAADLLLQEPPALQALGGQPLTISQTEQGFVNDAQLIKVNLVGSNGVVHIINSVLSPASTE
ncbi:MAG: DUF4397 domain-containing protein [Chloroflexi bacterium]|nr:DUF4397 domain-containing protein [Chloroflexota bacterium]